MEFSAIWQQCPRTKSAAASPAFHMGMYHVQEVANEFIPMNVYEGGGGGTSSYRCGEEEKGDLDEGAGFS